MTPEKVHQGRAQELKESRKVVLDLAHKQHPERFVNQAPELSQTVWINPLAKTRVCCNDVLFIPLKKQIDNNKEPNIFPYMHMELSNLRWHREEYLSS
jgi:hypothetical protein